jgi:hypothetical protein
MTLKGAQIRSHQCSAFSPDANIKLKPTPREGELQPATDDEFFTI